MFWKAFLLHLFKVNAVGFLRLSYDTPSYDLHVSALTTGPEECAEKCIRNEACNGFVYGYSTSLNNCWLKRRIAETGHCRTGYYTYVKIGKVLGIK